MLDPARYQFSGSQIFQAGADRLEQRYIPIRKATFARFARQLEQIAKDVAVAYNAVADGL